MTHQASQVFYVKDSNA